MTTIGQSSKLKRQIEALRKLTLPTEKKATAELPSDLHFSIVTVMKDPVMADDGRTYERVQIERWFESHTTSPKTGKSISRKLKPNHAVRMVIEQLTKG